jgi:hypothetical protein
VTQVTQVTLVTECDRAAERTEGPEISEMSQHEYELGQRESEETSHNKSLEKSHIYMNDSDIEYILKETVLRGRFRFSPLYFRVVNYKFLTLTNLLA